MKAFLKSATIAAVLSVSTLAQAAGGGANLPLPPPVNRAPQTPQVRCLKAFTANGYSVNDIMVQACRMVSGPLGAEAIENITATGKELSMDVVEAAVGISTDLSLACLKAFTAGSYTINDMMIRTCSLVSSAWAVRAIESVTSSGVEISMDAIDALTMINGRHSLKCVRTLTNHGYSIGTNETIIRTCQAFNSDAADASLEALASTGAAISIDTLEQISQM